MNPAAIAAKVLFSGIFSIRGLLPTVQVRREYAAPQAAKSGTRAMTLNAVKY
jgi:hypothetical protein